METIRLCSHEGCGQRIKSNGLCRPHYYIWFNAKRREERAANPEKIRAEERENYYKNKERKLASCLQYKNRNRPKLRARAKAYAKENRAAHNARNKLRDEAKRRQAPKWLSALDKEHFILFYEIASQLTKELGVPMHVDHIVPLRGEIVSGLHVPWNLQVIPAEENLKKNNSFNFEEYRQQWLST